MDLTPIEKHTIWDLPLRLPGLTDCHIHINDPRHAYVAAADLKPSPATVEQYGEVKQALGIERVVVVQPSSYGTDNSCTLEAVARFGDAARAVVVIDATWSAQQIEDLHAQGARGVRFNLLRPSPLTADAIEHVAALVAPNGWHLQLHAAPATIVALRSVLARLPVPVVFDHLGRLPAQETERQEAFAVIGSLLQADRAWVKLSGVELDGISDAPCYRPATALARSFIAMAPERVVWGSNWPHPASPKTFTTSDEADLLRWLMTCVPDEAKRQQILCTNPAALYGFQSD